MARPLIPTLLVCAAALAGGAVAGGGAEAAATPAVAGPSQTLAACLPDLPSAGSCGDGGPASAARLAAPIAAVPFADGGVVIADVGNQVVREISPDRVIRTTFARAGCAVQLVSPDGPDSYLIVCGPRSGRTATILLGREGGASAQPLATVRLPERYPNVTGVDLLGDRLIVGLSPGLGEPLGGRPALRLEGPPSAPVTSVLGLAASSLAPGPDGDVIVSDTVGGTVSVLTAEGSPVREVVASTPRGRCFEAVTPPGPQAPTKCLRSATPAPDGSVVVTVPGRVLRVAGDAAASLLVGDRRDGYAGDGGPAVGARISACGAIPAPDGGLLVVDTYNNRIRRVGPDGLIQTIAGSGPTATSTAGIVDFTGCPGERGGGADVTFAYSRTWNSLYLTGLPLVWTSGRPQRLTLYSSRPGLVRLEVLRDDPDHPHGRLAARYQGTLEAGAGTYPLPGIAEPGVYVVRVLATSGGDRRSIDSPLRVTRRGK